MKIFLLILALLGFLNAQESVHKESVHKVVFDLTTGDAATLEKRLLSGIAYQKTHYESKLEELEVAVVIHGSAYKFFIKDLAASPFKGDKNLAEKHADLSKRLASMSQTYGVEFLICAVGMKSLKIEESTLYDFVKIVPNATIGLIDKQNEGFAYIPIR